MATSDELVFAWAMGKVFLIVTVALGLLLYIAAAGTRRMLRDKKQSGRAVVKSALR
jgi:hypothetical protein